MVQCKDEDAKTIGSLARAIRYFLIILVGWSTSLMFMQYGWLPAVACLLNALLGLCVYRYTNMIRRMNKRLEVDAADEK